MTQVSFTLLHPNGVLVDRRGGFAPLLHTNPRPLALSFARALVLLACFSWLEVSQVTLKTTEHEA
jgi:hypothetical protein